MHTQVGGGGKEAKVEARGKYEERKGAKREEGKGREREEIARETEVGNGREREVEKERAGRYLRDRFVHAYGDVGGGGCGEYLGHCKCP